MLRGGEVLLSGEVTPWRDPLVGSSRAFSGLYFVLLTYLAAALAERTSVGDVRMFDTIEFSL
jgi:hypothetical protein